MLFRSLGGVGAVFAQSQIVFGRAAVVTVAADDDADAGMGGQVARGLGRGRFALLELLKLGEAAVVQSEPFGPIMVFAGG